MSSPLFDHRLRAARRDRAVRQGVETFLFDRAFEDCLDRLTEIRKPFRNVLLAGCPDPSWPGRLKRIAEKHVVVDPGPLMADRAEGMCADLESLPFEADQFDLCLSIGLLDTANDLPRAANAVRRILRKDGLFLGAIAGGNSLPRLRGAMLSADQVRGAASPHVHPRIEAPSLAQLLTASGFAMPVVDVDRVELAYRSVDSLVADLRAMGATNILGSRSKRPIARNALAAAREAFLGNNVKASEQIEILHFAAWNSA